MARILTLTLFLMSLPAIAFAQINWDIKLPDSVMKQVVSRILRYEFKSPRREKRVKLDSTHIPRDWLPDIKNIRFELIDPDTTADKDAKIFSLFELTKVEENHYQISVGWLDPCSGEGPVFTFWLKKQRVRLWYTNTTWASQCGAPVAVKGRRGLPHRRHSPKSSRSSASKLLSPTATNL